MFIKDIVIIGDGIIGGLSDSLDKLFIIYGVYKWIGEYL